MRKHFKFICIAITLIIGIERFSYWQTGGFRIAKIAKSVDAEETHFPGADIISILSSPFYFLGSGVQSYAFVSQDGQYVLKLFKSYHGWISTETLTHLPWTAKWLEERASRLNTIFASCKIAYDLWKEETALVYSHIHTSHTLSFPIYIVDKIGIAHKIDPNTTAFVLQKKANLVYPYLSTLKQQEAKEAIESLISLIVKRSKKGLCNHDPIIHRNFGYVNGKAVEIDIGSFSINEHMKKDYFWKRELFYTLANSPELLDFYENN